jgi:hypothetical protein
LVPFGNQSDLCYDHSATTYTFLFDVSQKLLTFAFQFLLSFVKYSRCVITIYVGSASLKLFGYRLCTPVETPLEPVRDAIAAISTPVYEYDAVMREQQASEVGYKAYSRSENARRALGVDG